MGVVEIKPRSAYGRTLIDPDNEAARLLCELTGRKTLLLEDLQLISKLGYRLQVNSNEDYDLNQLTRRLNDGQTDQA